MRNTITSRRFVASGASLRFALMMVAGLCSSAWLSSDLRAGPPVAKHQGRPCSHCGGRCGPHCPVRPGLYGFYGTQWRQWPGQGFMSSQEATAVTPAQPPRTAVPGPDEESQEPMPPPSEPAPPPSGDVLVPLPRPETPAKAKEPEKLDELETLDPVGEIGSPEPVVGEQDVPGGEPEVVQPAAPAPLPLEPSSRSPDDDNIFNSRYRPKSMRMLSMGRGATKPPAKDEGIVPASLVKPAAPKSVPPVPFDPVAETRELRIRIK